jgi:hypothetical protein
LVLAIQKFPIDLNTKFVDVPSIFNLLDLKWNKKWCESKYMNVNNHLKVKKTPKKSFKMSLNVYV